MARLASVSNTGGYERGAAALAYLLQDPYIAFLDQYNAFEEDTTDFDYRPDDGSGSIQERALGGAYTPSTETPAGRQNGALALMGDGLQIDISHIKDHESGKRDLGGWIDKRLNKKYRGWRGGLVQRMFNGTGAGSPRQMTGWKTIFDGSTNLPGYSITGVIDAAGYASGSPDSLDLTDKANYPLFVEIMDFIIAQVDDPRGLCMNKEMYARMQTIAVELNLMGSVRNHLDQPLLTWKDTPMIRLRDGAVTNVEPDNAGTPVNNTTSIWVQSPGEQRLAVVTNSGLEWYEDIPTMETKQSGQIRWEFRAENKAEDENACRRARNFKI